MTRVKTCGLNASNNVAAAVAAGADYYGFIYYPPSPRHLSFRDTKALTPLIGRDGYSVQVVVDPDDALVEDIADHSPCDFVQLHGHESPLRCAQVSAQTRRPIIKAISVRTVGDVTAARDYLPHVHALLFDAKPPSSDGFLPGGNGLSFDWTMLDQAWLKDQFWFLSGGLTAENVAQGIKLTGAPAVDVSSGIESAPGVKDLDKIAAFLAAAKGAE